MEVYKWYKYLYIYNVNSTSNINITQINQNDVGEMDCPKMTWRIHLIHGHFWKHDPKITLILEIDPSSWSMAGKPKKNLHDPSPSWKTGPSFFSKLDCGFSQTRFAKNSFGPKKPTGPRHAHCDHSGIRDPMIHCSLVNTLPVGKKTQKIVGGWIQPLKMPKKLFKSIFQDISMSHGPSYFSWFSYFSSKLLSL